MSETFDEDGFWEKIKNYAKEAGKEVIEKALCLFLAAQEADTPMWAKSVIYGALAYFVLPVDAIPDAIPLAGYADDLGALAAAISTVAIYITADIKERARQMVSQWFD